MNSQELLQNTEKSVGTGSLYVIHQELIAKRESQEGIEDNLKTARNILENDTKKFTNLKETVGSIKERKAAKKRVRIIEQKIAWKIYQESRARLEEAVKRHREAKKEKDSLEVELAPVTEEINKLKSEITEMNRTLKNHSSKITLSNQRFRGLLEKIDKLRDRIREAEQKCRQMIEEEKTRDDDIAQENLRKNKLENDVEGIVSESGSLDQLNIENESLAVQINEQRIVVSEFRNSMNVLTETLDNINREIARLQREQQDVQNVEAKKLNILKTRSHDAYRGVMWLRNNRDKFKSVIHEPMMLSIQPVHEKYAKYFESSISPRDLYAFVCEDVNDMNLLLRYLREEQNLTVNVLHVDPSRQVSRAPRVPLEQIKPFGFENYLVNLVEAPDTIMNYIVSTYGLNNIPIGSKKIDQHLNDIPSQIRRFFTPETCYSNNVSSYSGERSTSYSSFSSNGLLSTIIDNNRIRDIERGLLQKTEEKRRIEEQISSHQNEMREEVRKGDDLKNRKGEVTKVITKLTTIIGRLNVSRSTVKRLEEGRKSPELIQTETAQNIQGLINQQLKHFEEINSLFIASGKLASKVELFTFEVKLKTKVLTLRQNDSKDLRRRYQEADETYQEIGRNIAPLTDKSKELLRNAKESTDGYGPGNPEFQKYKDQFAKIKEETREELDNKLGKTKVQVHCLQSHENAEQVLRDYDETEKQIAVLQEQINQLEISLEVNKKEVDALREKWLNPLQALVNQINNSFSSHFQAMNCAGEVLLDAGENPLNYKDYGLKIRVKFRADDDLHEFTRSRQSGGERAVTTGIFMISLQELSRVPFRCVDELNQGMDATNEKMVFDLITRITAAQDSSQYFLLTPKLLPNLQYGKHVTVHCVFNGPFIAPSNEFSVSEFCANLGRSL